MRWSYYAGEYEEAPLVSNLLRFEKAVAARLAAAWERRVPPADPSLAEMYEAGLEYLGAEWDEETRLSEAGGETWYVLDVLEGIAGVVTSEEDSQTLVFFTANPAFVAQAIKDRIRELELEVAKVEG